MPYVRKFKKAAPKKRTYRRRIAKPKPAPARRKVTGPFRNFVSADPFRPTMSVKLKYSNTTTLYSTTEGAFGPVQSYRLNSLWDPNVAIGGDQPYGFDQLATLYKKYKVNGALIEAVFTDPDQDGMTLAVQLKHHNNTYVLTAKSADELREKPNIVVRTINNTGKQRVVVKQYMPLDKLSGITKLQFKADADLFTALVGENPQVVPTVAVACGSNRGVTNANVTCRMTITYYATMYERVTLAQST